MFKVNIKNKNTRTHVIDVILVSLLLTLNIFHTFFKCFYSWVWKSDSCVVLERSLFRILLNVHNKSFLLKQVTAKNHFHGYIPCKSSIFMFDIILSTSLMADAGKSVYKIGRKIQYQWIDCLVQHCSKSIIKTSEREHLTLFWWFKLFILNVFSIISST